MLVVGKAAVRSCSLLFALTTCCALRRLARPPTCLQALPREHSEQFAAAGSGFSDVEAVLKAGIRVAATQIAAEPLVRQEVRKQYEVSWAGGRMGLGKVGCDGGRAAGLVNMATACRKPLLHGTGCAPGHSLGVSGPYCIPSCTAVHFLWSIQLTSARLPRAPAHIFAAPPCPARTNPPCRRMRCCGPRPPRTVKQR